MTNKSSKVLELYATGSWKSLKAMGAIIKKDHKQLSPTQALLLCGICESPLESNYSPEIIRLLKEKNPTAALGLIISRASITHAIAKLIVQDVNTAKEYAQSSLSALISSLDLVGLKTSKKKKQMILNSATFLTNCLHSQLELKQTLLENKLSRNLTFVLGMHRSGTSALTGMLAHAGFSAPKELMPANSHNPKGYWESTGIMKANDILLESFSSLWSTTAKLPVNWAYTEQARLWRESLLNCFKEDFTNCDNPIIKDPRFCILIEGLKPWLESDLIHPKFIIVIRDPCEVVQSLKKVQNISISRGFLLWISYNLKAIAETHGYIKRIVDYHLLLENPSNILDLCLEILDENPGKSAFKFDPTEFIESNLCNEDAKILEREITAADEDNIKILKEYAQKIHMTMIEKSHNIVLLEKSLNKLEYKFMMTAL